MFTFLRVFILGCRSVRVFTRSRFCCVDILASQPSTPAPRRPTGAEKRISIRVWERKKKNQDTLDNNNAQTPPTTHASVHPCDVIKTITQAKRHDRQLEGMHRHGAILSSYLSWHSAHLETEKYWQSPVMQRFEKHRFNIRHYSKTIQVDKTEFLPSSNSL